VTTSVAFVASCAAVGLMAGWFLAVIAARESARRGGGPQRHAVTVSLVTAGLFAAVAARFGWTSPVPAYLLLVGFLVVLSVVDLRTKTLPRRVVHAAWLGGVVLLVPAAVLDGEPEKVASAALGAACAFVALVVLHTFARGGFGFGDVRLGAMLGWYVGWQQLSLVAVCLTLAFLLSAFSGLALVALGRANRRTVLPFGPFLAVGALAAILG